MWIHIDTIYLLMTLNAVSLCVVLVTELSVSSLSFCTLLCARGEMEANQWHSLDSLIMGFLLESSNENPWENTVQRGEKDKPLLFFFFVSGNNIINCWQGKPPRSCSGGMDPAAVVLQHSQEHTPWLSIYGGSRWGGQLPKWQVVAMCQSRAPALLQDVVMCFRQQYHQLLIPQHFGLLVIPCSILLL